MGIAAGFLAGALGGDGGKIGRIESMAVGVFGAFIGGEFIASLMAEPPLPGPTPPVTGVTGTAIMMGAAGVVVALAALRLMRRAVGPLKAGKSRQRH